MSTWPGHQMPRYMVKYYFWVHVLRCSQKRPAFELLDWVKLLASLWVGIIQPADGQMREGWFPLTSQIQAVATLMSRRPSSRIFFKRILAQDSGNLSAPLLSTTPVISIAYLPRWTPQRIPSPGRGVGLWNEASEVQILAHHERFADQ